MIISYSNRRKKELKVESEKLRVEVTSQSPETVSLRKSKIGNAYARVA